MFGSAPSLLSGERALARVMVLLVLVLMSATTTVTFWKEIMVVI